jgi:hypothetical protein
MKYIEEIEAGDCFEFNKKFYVLTRDFKKNGDRLCVALQDGSPNWLKPDSIIQITDLFTMDKDNNIIAIRERKKDVLN